MPRTVDVPLSSDSEDEDLPILPKRRRDSNRRTSPSKRKRINANGRSSETSRASDSRTSAVNVVDDSSSDSPEPRPRKPQMARPSGGRPGGGSSSKKDANATAGTRMDASAQGVAGPGPETSRSRAQRNLGPVPVPSPSTLRDLQRSEARFLDPIVSQVESIGTFSSPPQGRQAADEAEDNNPAQLLDGEEILIVTDSELAEGEIQIVEDTSSSPSAAGDEYKCRWAECEEIYRSPEELGRHIRDHADCFDVVQVDSEMVKNLKAELDEANQDASDLNALIVELRGNEAQHAKEIESLKGQLQILTERDSNQPEASHATELEEERKKIESLTAQLAETTAAVQELKDDKQLFRRQLETEKSVRIQRDQTIASLREQTKTLKESNATLEGSIKAMEEAAVKTAEEDQVAASLATEGLSESEQILALRKQLKRTTKQLASSNKDYAYIQSVYQQATGEAATAIAARNDLEEVRIKLEEQLKVGLAQRDKFHAAQLERYKADAKLARQQLEVLQEQNRRTDDKVRTRATLYKPVQQEKDELELELHRARGQVHSFKERIEVLVEQVALLRGRLMGAFDAPEVGDEDDDEEEPEAEMTPSPSPEAMRPTSIPTFAPDDSPAPALVPDTSLDGGVEAFLRCKWGVGVGDSFCQEIFQSREAGIQTVFADV